MTEVVVQFKSDKLTDFGETLKFWQDSDCDAIQTYISGTSGPLGADKLLERYGRKWRQL